MSEHTEELSFFEQRMQLLGVTDELNSVNLWAWDKDSDSNQLKPRPVFSKSAKGIEILVYTLDRRTVRIEKPGSKQKTDYAITRYEVPIVKASGDVMKYHMPKGQATLPFFPPALLDAFDSQTAIPVLYITEGYFKAFKATMHGIMCVGVPSITCIKDRNTGKLYGDVLRLIQTCKVQRLVWLTDGDCRDLTSKEITDGIDLYRRPANFYNTVAQFADLTSGLEDTQRYFAHINTHNLDGAPKGLDDVFCTYLNEQGERKEHDAAAIVADAHSFDSIKETFYPGKYFIKANITNNVGKVRKYFHLDSVDNFWNFYSETRPEIKNVKFKFHGTLYKYNGEEGKCEVVIPKAASDYVRVGDHYFENISIPDKHGNINQRWDRREKATIKDDHGKDIFGHIYKYNAFCTVPDHQNYQRIINNCFNSYHPFDHEAEAGDCSVTLNFFKHIFGTHPVKAHKMVGGVQVNYEIKSYELGLDYFTLLYKNPQHTLPILCLASSENNTGKSTFVTYLKYVFGQNAAIVSNEDLASGFNGHWAGKLLVMCEETKIDKDIVVEKVKALSTGSKIMMNRKGQDQVEVDFFGKFIFCTNNEDNFLPITNNDVRYWVIKVPKIADLILDMEKILQEELPAFLHFINSRQMATERQYRHWFLPQYLRTDALEKVIKNSQPNIIKRLYGQLERIFNAYDGMNEETHLQVPALNEICMPAQDIANLLNRKDDAEYIRRELRKMNYTAAKVARGKYPTVQMVISQNDNYEPKIVWNSFHSSYYIFKREAIQAALNTEDYITDHHAQQLPATPVAQPVETGGTQEKLPF